MLSKGILFNEVYNFTENSFREFCIISTYNSPKTIILLFLGEQSYPYLRIAWVYLGLVNDIFTFISMQLKCAKRTKTLV